MQIFLSYASEQHGLAEQVAFALRNEGHQVFFDHSQIAASDNFHAEIREGITASDLFVFLISPEAVEKGCYALTEVKIASERWSQPRGRVLPVMVRATPLEAVPGFLRAVSVLHPSGDVVAEVVAAVERIRRERRRRLVRRLAGAAIPAAIAAAILLFVLFPRTNDRTLSPGETPSSREAVDGRLPSAAAAADSGAAARHVSMLLDQAQFAATWRQTAQQVIREREFSIQNHRLSGTRVQWVASPNHHTGVIRPEFLVFHYTAAASMRDAVQWLTDPRSKSSTHLLIARDGAVTQMVPFNVGAWHAGQSTEGVVQGLNRSSIGIELDNPGELQWRDGAYRLGTDDTTYPADDVIAAPDPLSSRPAYWHTFTEVQLRTAAALARLLAETYQVQSVIGHYDVAAGRKTDPGPAFPMGLLKLAVFEDDPYAFSAETYRQVLALDRGNLQARQGLQQIVDRYVVMADGAIQAGEQSRAEQYLQQAERLQPASAAVRSARQRLRAAIGS